MNKQLMNKLSKEQSTKLEQLRARWVTARSDLEAEEATANEAIAAAAEKVNAWIADLNALIEEANELRGDVETSIQEAYDNKSEKWQDGDRGQAYYAWCSQWSEELAEVETIEGESLDVVSAVPEELLPEDEYAIEPNE